MKKIQLTRGYFALVDDEDFEKFNKYKWQRSLAKTKSRKVIYAKTGITQSNGIQRTVRMHRMILNAKKDEIVDHINGNGLDNRKGNLRIVTNRQNHQNRHIKVTSKYPGVYWKKDNSKWMAKITAKNKQIYLGLFESEDEAYKAYKWACDEVENGNIIKPISVFKEENKEFLEGE